MEPTQLFQHFIRRPASACAAGAGVLALLAWWCLLFGDAASRSGQTTMDPATAGSMMLLSLGLFLFNRHRSSPAVRRFALFAAFGVAAVSLYFGLQFIFGFDLTAKNLAPFSSPANNILSHRMSPLSAAAFLSAAVAFCLELLPPDRRRIYRQTATLSALAVFLSGSLVIIKYALGMPVISDIHNHPMTLMEAISFALLGLGIVILSRFDFLDRDIAECDRIEGELRQSVERQQLFCEQSSLAIIEWDQIFRVTQWNPAAERMFGYKAEEAVGQFVTFLVSPDAQEDAKRLLMNLTVKQDAVSNTNNIRTKDGRTIVCRWNNTPLTGSDGKFLGAVSLCEEITEHKRTEEQLERLAAVIHNCSELVAISTLKGETVFLNEPGCEMLGIDPSNAQRHSYLEFVSGFYRKEVERKIVPALLRGKTWKGELQYRNLKTGKPVDVQATFFVIREPVSGNPLYYANISLDITERKRAEASLHEKDRKLQLFAENVSDLIWSINFAAKATYISPSVKQFLGYEPAEFSRFTFKDYMTPDSAQYALSRLEKAIAEHRPGHLLKPDTFELECRRKDGTTVWTEIQTNGAYDEKGELVGIQGITRDIGKPQTGGRNAEGKRTAASTFRRKRQRHPLGNGFLRRLYLCQPHRQKAVGILAGRSDAIQTRPDHDGRIRRIGSPMPCRRGRRRSQRTSPARRLFRGGTLSQGRIEALDRSALLRPMRRSRQADRSPRNHHRHRRTKADSSGIGLQKRAPAHPARGLPRRHLGGGRR